MEDKHLDYFLGRKAYMPQTRGGKNASMSGYNATANKNLQMFTDYGIAHSYECELNFNGKKIQTKDDSIFNKYLSHYWDED